MSIRGSLVLEEIKYGLVLIAETRGTGQSLFCVGFGRGIAKIEVEKIFGFIGVVDCVFWGR